MRSSWFATALMGRLRVDGRADLADAVTSLLRDASLDCDPRFRLDEDDGSLAGRSAWVAQLRAEGRHEDAAGVKTGRLIRLMSSLLGRLRVDGHRDLAAAIEAAWTAVDAQAIGVDPELDRDAELLAYAAVTRLRAEGREILAGTIMSLWVDDATGPIVEPRALVAACVARLRAEGRDALADEIASVSSGVATERDAEEIMALWQRELARPVVAPGPLAAAMLAALRSEGRDALADAIGALLNGEMNPEPA